MSKTELFIKKENNPLLMGKLEDIAKKLGDWVKYSFEDNIEIIYYKDKKSKVGAVKAPDYQGIRCDIDVIYLDSYLEQLSKFDNSLAKRIYENLNSRNITNYPKDPNIAQTLIGDYFELSDFKDVPEIMKMHKKFSDD